MTPAELVIAEARRYVGVTEVPKGSNRGLEIDYWIKECGLDPKGAYAWCAAFVGQVGRQAVGARWPCPRSAGVQALADWATKAACLQATPAAGDLMVFWHADLKRFAHIGVVTAVHVPALGFGGPTSVDTIEGNTNAGGGREGWGVLVKTRSPKSDDRFIRWAKVLVA